MNLRINRSIAEQTKVSYAIESAGPLPMTLTAAKASTPLWCLLRQKQRSKNWISK